MVPPVDHCGNEVDARRQGAGLVFLHEQRVVRALRELSASQRKELTCDAVSGSFAVEEQGVIDVDLAVLTDGNDLAFAGQTIESDCIAEVDSELRQGVSLVFGRTEWRQELVDEIPDRQLRGGATRRGAVEGVDEAAHLGLFGDQ